jgi:hypothetical protein
VLRNVFDKARISNMPGVSRLGEYLVTQHITGPQCLLLMLDMQPERIADPPVTALEVCPIYGQPSDAVVRAAVLAGTDRANAEFGTSWHPLEIRYSYSGYDNARCQLMDWAGYNIVKALAEGTVTGPEQRSAEPDIVPDQSRPSASQDS